MHPILRVIVGVVTGIIVSFVIVAAVEICSIKIFPLPPGTNMMDPASVKAAMAGVPDGARALVVVGWFLGAAVGTFLAAKIARSMAQGAIVGAILLTMAVLDMRSFPHPAWMWGRRSPPTSRPPCLACGSAPRKAGRRRRHRHPPRPERWRSVRARERAA